MIKHKIIGVIPARYDSTRLPGKPLININGKPMIQHVWERSLKSKLIDKIIVATDDKKIFDVVKRFGGDVIITSKKHKSGTDRIGEVAKKIQCGIIVNIQGDEPFINPKNIDRAIKPLLSDKNINVSTLCCKIKNNDDLNNPCVVKVVFDKNNNALYFSRFTVQYVRGKQDKSAFYKHIGLYVYRKNFLLKLIKLKQSKLEKTEKLEQLRILENGEKIKVVVTDIDSHSIDTQEDIKRFKGG